MTPEDREKYQQFSRYAAEEAARREQVKYHRPGVSGRIVRIFLLVFVLIAVAAALGIMRFRPDIPEYFGITVPAVIREWSPGNIGIPGFGKGKRRADDQAAAESMSESLTEDGTEEATEEETEIQTEAPLVFQPHSTDQTAPANLILSTGIEDNGEELAGPAGYSPWYHFDFGREGTYTDVEGVITFRGDNFRNSPAYGRADLHDNLLSGIWSHDTGGLTYKDATWTGSGWTGQPLLVRWPASVKAHMNMADWAKEDDDLVEVIYACMDGYIYFLDMRTGDKTREALYLGYTCKGSGALDPRGYPLMYVGAGYDSYEGTARAFIINLLDCSVLYTFGNNDSYSLRGNLSYFDSSALVDAQSDTLIYPGENGILYLIHLNTAYDENAGTISVNPDRFVKWHYQGVRTGSQYWVGMEDSAAVYEGYLFIADNGGNLMCMDLNTLQLVWVQDILDDSNSTPVLSVEDGHLYLYVSTSFHLGWRSSSTAPVPIWKIDADTGEIVWQTEYECYTEDGVSGGVQSTIAVGREKLSDYLYVTVSRTGDPNSGVLACLDKKTGQIAWEHGTVYAWSSPVCVYDSDGKGKVIYCSCGGKMFLLDGISGGIYDSLELSNGAIEASPAAFDNYVVIGTRACKIWGVRLS